MVSFPGSPGVIVDVVVCFKKPWGLRLQYRLGIREYFLHLFPRALGIRTQVLPGNQVNYVAVDFFVCEST